MQDVADFLNRYFDAEFETHKLDLAAKNAKPVHKAFIAMNNEFFARAGIQMLSDYLHTDDEIPPSAAVLRDSRADLQRRPLFRVERYGKGKTELFRGLAGMRRKTRDQAYRAAYFVRRMPELRIVATYRAAIDFITHVVPLEWEGGCGEKIALGRLRKPAEILRVQAPTHKPSLALYNSDD